MTRHLRTLPALLGALAILVAASIGLRDVEAAGDFVAPPVFGSLGLAQAVFTGGTVGDLESASRAAGASGAWVQDAGGAFRLLPVDAPAFLRDEFAAAFPPAQSGALHFPGPTAVTLVRLSGATPAPETVEGVLPGPDATPVALPNQTQLSAPSAEVAWALVAGERLSSSTDRGATWTARGVPPAASSATTNEIAFIDAREGWLLAAGQPADRCAQQPVTFWHTADAGAHWTRLPATGLPAAQCKSAPSFTDAMHGFVVAHNPDGAAVIYRTSDGGGTWAASTPLAVPAGAEAAGLEPGTVRAFGDTLLVPVRSVGLIGRYVYRSTDGGATWQHAATVDDQQAGFAIVTAQRWITLAPPEASRETTDAGASWHAFATDYTQAAPIPPVVVFGSPQVGYATVRGIIERTSDGGASWTRIDTPGTE